MVRARQRFRIVAMGVLLVVLGVGCGGGGDPEEAGSPSPSDPVAVDTGAGAPDERAEVDPVEREILAAYQGFWDAILAANDPPDQFHPALREYATGAAYESVFEAAQANRATREALRLPPNSITEHRAEVVAIRGDEATVRDCAIDDGLVIDLDTGEVLDDDVLTTLATATLVREDGAWKVSNTIVEQTWQGVAGCAVAS